MEKLRILIIEDDQMISDMQKELLTYHGYDVTAAFSGTEGLLRYRMDSYDLVLLDLMLPGMDGRDVLVEMRKNSDIPVICVSARDEVESRVDLIRQGADDYLVKPFNNDELLVRIEAVLRRRVPQAAVDSMEVLRYKDVEVDTSAYSVRVKGKPITLTKREYLILELMMRHPNKVFTKNNIYESVWEEEFYGDDNTVNVHISNIRQKLAAVNSDEQYIQTVWGIGFKLYE